MITLVDFIKEFEGMVGGIAGAMLGAIATLMATHWLNQKGKVHFNIINLVDEQYFRDVYNEKEPYNPDKDNELEVVIHAELYNSSNTYKHIKDVTLVFVKNSNSKSFKMKDESTRRYGRDGIFTYVDDMEYINVSPRELIRLELRKVLSENKEEIQYGSDVFLEYFYQKKFWFVDKFYYKKRRVFLFKI